MAKGTFVLLSMGTMHRKVLKHNKFVILSTLTLFQVILKPYKSFVWATNCCYSQKILLWISSLITGHHSLSLYEEQLAYYAINLYDIYPYGEFLRIRINMYILWRSFIYILNLGQNVWMIAKNLIPWKFHSIFFYNAKKREVDCV